MWPHRSVSMSTRLYIVAVDARRRSVVVETPPRLFLSVIVNVLDVESVNVSW